VEKYFTNNNRQSLRLDEYDYSTPGVYFVTICVNKHLCLFGGIEDEDMKVNAAGRMVWKWWNELNNKFEIIQTDEAVVMPNHFHGIVIINENSNVGAALCGRPTKHQQMDGNNNKPPNTPGQPHRVAPTSLFDVMEWFKTMTTNEYIRNVKQSGWLPFHKKLWQRSYYDRIVRDEDELNSIREYVMYNPLKWGVDQNHPQNWSLNDR